MDLIGDFNLDAEDSALALGTLWPCVMKTARFLKLLRKPISYQNEAASIRTQFITLLKCFENRLLRFDKDSWIAGTKSPLGNSCPSFGRYGGKVRLTTGQSPGVGPDTLSRT
jgi:hypothetical protein